MRPNVPSLPPYWADEPAMFTDEDGFRRQRLWRQHQTPSGRLARIALVAYRPDPDVPAADRQPRPGHQGEWLLGVYIVTPANDITARAAVMLWRRPEGRFYVADAAIAGFGVAVDKALDSVQERSPHN
jgi:hypothetical protein